MRTPRKKTKANGKPRRLANVHRYAGLSSAAFVLLLSVTGLLLNHNDELQLDSIYVQNDRLLSWYGIAAPQDFISFAVGDDFVTVIDKQVYRNTAPLQLIKSPFVGALVFHDMFLLASENSLFAYSRQWQLIEKLDDAAGLPLDLIAIGVASDGQLALDTANGHLLGDKDLLEWQQTNSLSANWARRTDTPTEIKRDLLIAYRGTGLSLERVMLDLHSGRLFGKPGVLLVDAAAILFVVLACSGIWLWARRRKR